MTMLLYLNFEYYGTSPSYSFLDRAKMTLEVIEKHKNERLEFICDSGIPCLISEQEYDDLIAYAKDRIKLIEKSMYFTENPYGYSQNEKL